MNAVFPTQIQQASPSNKTHLVAAEHCEAALGLETAFYQKMRDVFIKVSKLRIRSTHLSGGFDYIGVFISTVGTLAYGWYGWTQVLRGELSLGSFMAFSGYVGYLYGPIGNLIGLVGQVEMALVHINLNPKIN